MQGPRVVPRHVRRCVRDQDRGGARTPQQGGSRRAGVFDVRPAAADAPPTWASNLLEHVGALESKTAALAAAPPPAAKSKEVLDGDVARRPRGRCAADPKPVDSGAAGQRWDGGRPDED